MDRAENAKWLEGIIREFINSPENSLQNEAREKAWDEPLVGFSSGGDPLYDEFKEYVGPFHWTPREIFSLAFPGPEVGARAAHGNFLGPAPDCRGEKRQCEGKGLPRGALGALEDVRGKYQ